MCTIDGLTSNPQAELNAPEKAMRCLKQADNTFALPSPRTCIPMDDPSFAIVTSIFTLGGLLGALSSGPISTAYGRLLPLRLASVFFVLGPLFSALAPNMGVLVTGRFLSGVGSGAALVIVPIYIGEVAPTASRGLFGSLTQITINVGILLAQVLGFFLNYGAVWRVVLAVAGGLAVVQAAGLFGVVESPKWLASREKMALAKRILQRIRGDTDIEPEVAHWGNGGDGEGKILIPTLYVCSEDWKLFVREDSNVGIAEYESLLAEQDGMPGPPKRRSEKESIGIFQVITHPDYYKAIIAVVGVMLAQQLCGINSVIMYSVSFLSDLLPTAAGLITVGVGVLNLVVTVLCASLPDRLGRKLCLMLSIAGMGISTLLLALAILFGVKILSAVATLLIVASFAFGLGPIPFLLASELVGPEAVGATQSWALAANWIAVFIVAQFFPILNIAMGDGKVFFLFAGVAAISFTFVAFFVPETMGKTADEAWGRAERRED